VPVPLDTNKMAGAIEVLIGHHDFNSFRSVSCQAKSPIRTLDEFSVQRDGEEVLIDVGARSFLHNQVRILVGTLALVGRGQWTRRDVEEALAACDRKRAGPTAPPLGLCLTEVVYGPSGAGKRDDSEEPVDDE
jgi:tRNA pseudouridine38-40 synthase